MPRKKTPPRSPSPPALECPAHLNDEARAEWIRLVALLAAAKLLENVDRAALAAYCVAYARWCEAEREISNSGLIVRSPNGYPIQSPYLAVANKAMTQMKTFLDAFGMSPTSRKRVAVKTKAAAEPDDDNVDHLLD